MLFDSWIISNSGYLCQGNIGRETWSATLVIGQSGVILVGGYRDVGDLLTYSEFETAQQVSWSRHAAQLYIGITRYERGEMGVTIYYRGKLENTDELPEFREKLMGIALSFGWQFGCWTKTGASLRKRSWNIAGKMQKSKDTLG